MKHAANSSKIDANNYPWVVEFHVASPGKIEMMKLVGPHMFYRIVELWLKVIAPNSCVLEQDDIAIRRVRFPTRSLARRFVSVWCGKLTHTV
jgi:hypothetical protein